MLRLKECMCLCVTLAEQSWAVKAELGMQCWNRKSLCVTLAEESWALKAELRNEVLGLKLLKKDKLEKR